MCYCALCVALSVHCAVRFGLSELKVSGEFGDKDMLALADLFCKYWDTELAHITKVDFSAEACNLRSHGAVSLAQVSAMVGRDHV